MPKFLIKGGKALQGEVRVSGSKNAALPILFSALLSEGKSTFKRVPDLQDIRTTNKLLESMGCGVSFDPHTHTAEINAAKISQTEASYDLVRKMRASVLVLGPLVARFGEAKVSLPGGCAIGARPINFHLMALEKMGAKIEGLGSPSIEIEGVKKLSGVTYSLITDRIEAGTYMIASAMTKGDVTIKNMNLNMLGAMLDKLRDAGVMITEKNGNVRIRRERILKPVSVTTLPYPGFPTDLQAQMMALMCIIPGISVITEKIYPERFMHVSELNRMGASIMLEGPSAIVSGKKHLSGAPVMASDLRASAGLVLAGLVAEGETEISRVYHLDRGYENLVSKLQSLGAKIRREKDTR